MNGSEQRRANRLQRTVSYLFVVLCSLFALRSLSWGAEEAYYNYMRGLVEERAGHTAKALEAYEKVVQEDPQALEAYRDIAELHLRLGQPEAALRAAERVKDLAPTDPTSFVFLGNVLVAQGDLAKAAEAYENALKLDPRNLRALENLGNYYAILDPDKALSYYQRLVDIDPRDADIYFQMALVHQKKGNSAQALALYQKSVQLDPQQLASHLAMADLYDDQKSTAAAIAEYEFAAKRQPANPLIFLRLGNLYYRNQMWDDAQQAFKAVEALSPQDATVHYWLARVTEEKKLWKEAASEAEKAYGLSKDAQFLPLTAYYLTLDRQLQSAVKYLEKAREADPKNANVLLFLGMDYLDLEKPEKAKEALVKGVALYPKDPQMRFQLAITEDRLGHFDDAAREFQDLLAIDPKNAAAMNYLGYSYADKGIHLEEAEKLLRQAVAFEPDNGAYLDSLGWVRFKRGKYSEARNFLESAVIHTPDPLIYDHLGDAAFADSHPEAALQAWSKSIFMDPKNETVRKKLQEQGTHFLNSPQSRKYLKYIEGNLRQAQNLEGDMALRGELNKRVLQTQGKLYYAQPDRIMLDVPAGPKTKPVQFVMKGTTERVVPPQTNAALSQMAFQGLASLTQFLSGKITDTLQASMDPRTGIQTRFSRPNPSGGQDEIQVVAYDFTDGIWLPSEIQVRNSTMGWEAKLSFSNWIINQRDDVLPFK
jgi:tetratricopeptide (TPR) repeat protein